MAYYLKDNSIVPQAFQMLRKQGHFSRKRRNYAQFKARVDEILYSDDDKNTTKKTGNPQVEYNCTILGGPEAGRRLFNVKSVVPLGSGSIYNSGEIIHTPKLDGSTPDREGDTINAAEKTTGAIVIISRLHGHENGNVITGCLKHPGAPSVKKEDGQSMNYSFMGMTVKITKDGAFSLSFGGGPKDKDGKAANEANAGGTFSISKDGVVKMSDGDGQEITIDKAKKTLKMASSQGMEFSTGANWKIDVGGSVNLNAGGAMNLGGSVISIGGGGLPAARLNDIVMGTDGEGRPINAYIATGSGTALIGG